jgi:hypothetical protein
VIKQTIYVNKSGHIVPEINVLMNENTGEIFDSETGDILYKKEIMSPPIESPASAETLNTLPSSHLPMPQKSTIEAPIQEERKPLPMPSTSTIKIINSDYNEKDNEDIKYNNTVTPSHIPNPYVEFPAPAPPKEISQSSPNSIPMQDGLPVPQGSLPLKNEEKIIEPNIEEPTDDEDDEDLFPSIIDYDDEEYSDDELEVYPTISNVDSLKEKVRKSTWEAGGRPSENKAKIPEIINIESWTDDVSSDPHIGLGSENDIASKELKPKVNRNIVLNERDYIMMSFMTRYRYCYSDQLARLVGAENKDVRARLAKLEKEGYIRREVITRGQDLWLTRKAGLQMIGSPYAPINKGQVSTLYIQHTIGVGNLGVELEMLGEGKNILGENNFPQTNRYPYGIYNPDESPTLKGEMTITEREIRSSNRVLKGGNTVTTLDLKHKVEEVVNSAEAIERLEGNEWMFVVYGKGEHFPDLVIHRERASDGKPQHIAIELELTAKDLPSWRRILKWYKEYGIMYSKVYYFTHNRTIATRLNKVIEELSMEEFVIVRKYVPANNRGPFWG